jgi:arylsulfatase
MTKPWKGKIAVDIRESKPDWEPYIQPQAPEGSPNILYIVCQQVPRTCPSYHTPNKI